MSDDPRYQVKHPEIEAALKDIGKRLGEAVRPHNFGFALFLYPFSDQDSGVFYIANGSRSDILKMLMDFIERQTQEAELERIINEQSAGEG